MTQNSVQITLTKRGLIIYATILVLLDTLSTYLVARFSVIAFLEYELNPFMRMAFANWGWWSFVIYPIFPILLYAFLISAGFGVYHYCEKRNKGRKATKIFFYLLGIYLSFHFMVIISNLTLYYTLTCK